MARSLFVYWKTPRAMLDAATASLAAAQRGLVERHPGLQARLYRRADDDGELATLMETYARDGGIDATLAQAVDAAADGASAGFRHGARHVEVFEEGPG